MAVEKPVCYGKREEKAANTCPVGNPTLPGLGIKVQTETDYSPSFSHPLVFERHYRSRFSMNAGQAATGGWQHTYSARLQVVTTASKAYVYAYRATGEMELFTPSAEQATWTSEDQQLELSQLVSPTGAAQGWRLLRRRDGVAEVSDVSGRLLRIEQPNGWALRLQYDAQGLLQTITNHFGRQLTLGYDSDGRLNALTQPGGEVIRYAYGGFNTLISVTWPDGQIKQYHYENNAYPTALTGVTDEAGQRVSIYSYDEAGRVIDSHHPNSSQRHQFTYDPSGLQTRVTDFSSGTPVNRTYSFTPQDRVLSLSSIVSTDTTTATERNAQGQPTRQVNPDGSVTFYKYNERGLEIERALFDATFAIATTRPGLAKATSVTSTRWHGQWNLPKEVAQPQLTTSYTYNARGDITGYSTQATTDPTGAQKFEAIGTGPLDAMGYAYNANAQLSRIVQLQNGTETARWTLGYNDQGDVQRITYTDATTIDPTTLAPTETTQRIPQHDPHGRPTVIVDPDGNRTRLSYNARGALTRLVQGEAITNFTYDARGVMTRIKTPDGSVFALVYDSDVNLTQVKHNGKAITAAYVATLSAEVKTTVAEIAKKFSWVFTEEVLNALNSTSSRQQAQREKPRKAWNCTRPLDGLPGANTPLLKNHEYICVTQINGLIFCKGLTVTSGTTQPFGWPSNALYGVPAFSSPKDDYYHKDACTEIDDDKDQCFEKCILDWNKLPEYYSIFLNQCKQFANQMYISCKTKCFLNK